MHTAISKVANLAQVLFCWSLSMDWRIDSSQAVKPNIDICEIFLAPIKYKKYQNLNPPLGLYVTF